MNVLDGLPYHSSIEWNFYVTVLTNEWQVFILTFFSTRFSQFFPCKSLFLHCFCTISPVVFPNSQFSILYVFYIKYKYFISVSAAMVGVELTISKRIDNFILSVKDTRNVI